MASMEFAAASSSSLAISGRTLAWAGPGIWVLAAVRALVAAVTVARAAADRLRLLPRGAMASDERRGT